MTSLACQMSMVRYLTPWGLAMFVLSVQLIAEPTVYFQSPATVPNVSQENADQTIEEEKASYDIYSILLRMEMTSNWNITGWVIRRETQVYPIEIGQIGENSICLQPTGEQEPTYRPLIDDYLRKNRKKLHLQRQFDLSQYAILEDAEIQAIQQRPRPEVPPSDTTVAKAFPFNASVIFHVSAVGFNPEMTRALVYVGHDCGSLCGGGTYHFMIKKNGRWLPDRDYRGRSCRWAS